MWRSTPEVQNSSSWSSAGPGGGGVVGVLPSSPFHFLPGCGYCSPHHHAQNMIPGQMCCSGGQADLCVCVAFLHHSTISARKLNSSLVISVLLWCSAKLNPPQLCCKWFASQKLSRVCGAAAGISLRRSPTSVSGLVESLATRAGHRRRGQKRPASTPDQPGERCRRGSGALINLGSSIRVHCRLYLAPLLVFTGVKTQDRLLEAACVRNS